MDQIHFSFSGNPKRISNLEKNEKGKLQGSHGILLDIFQYPCAITESLKSQGIEIREARDLNPTPHFMPLAAEIVRGQNLDVYSEHMQFLAEVENEYPGGIARKSGEGGCENKNSHDLPTESKAYLRSLLYSMSNHMPKKRLCSPLTRVKTKAMALIRGMAP